MVAGQVRACDSGQVRVCGCRSGEGVWLQVR